MLCARNSERAYKNAKKDCRSFKLDKSSVVRIGMTAVKPYLSICPVGLVWFARYCGKMYSRHLFTVDWLKVRMYWPCCTRSVYPECEPNFSCPAQPLLTKILSPLFQHVHGISGRAFLVGPYVFFQPNPF